MATETQGSPTLKKAKRYGIIIFSILLILGILGGGYYTMGDFSDGYRAGKIRKFSRKGVIFKTWEGEMALEATGVAQEVFYFSVDNSNQTVVQAIEKAMLEGSRVNAHYAEKFIQVSWRGETKYFLDKIEVKP